MTREMRECSVIGCILLALLVGAWFIAEWDRSNPRPALPRPYSTLPVIANTLEDAALDLSVYEQWAVKGKRVEDARDLNSAAGGVDYAHGKVRAYLRREKERREKRGNDTE